MSDTNAVEELRAIVSSGSEVETMQYIKDHFQEFPKQLQQGIVVGLYTDAAKQDLENRIAVADVKSQILSLLREFDALDKQAQ